MIKSGRIRYYNRNEAAKKAGIDVSTLGRWTRRGLVEAPPRLKHNGHHAYTDEHIEAILKVKVEMESR